MSPQPEPYFYDMERIIIIMKRIALMIALATSLLIPDMASAAGGRFGIGVMAGEPTGLSAKLHLNKVNALDFGVAWSFSGSGHFHLHADYIFHKFGVINVDSGQMPLYFGVGARILFREDNSDEIGIRVPIGVAYIFEETPIDLFAEIVPILDLNPDTDLNLNAAIGARFFF
jgi:hypothetical protein